MDVKSIKRRSLLVAATSLVAGSRARAQAALAATRVTMQTDKGLIVLELAGDRAPITTANFLRYVDTGRFDRSSFYRASRSPGAPRLGLIEGGLQNDPARLLPPIVHESTLATGLAHLDGTISMARTGQGTATADFFICSGPAKYLDANPSAPGDNAGYAAFGHVVEGLEVVRTILALPTPGVARNPVMKGQILDPPVAICSMRRAG